jgi:DNA-binding NtrC family response regulator
MPQRREEVSGDGAPMIGRSAAMQALRRLIERVAPNDDATVLILGERGTGKELVARELQRGSPRRDRPYVVVNCAALPRELLASELFGHERGAFTGALERTRGLVAEAAGGTLFLDEVGDLSLEAQAMLLRFLQEREVRPVGSTRTVTIDVRVLAATNRDLESAVARREFRADLYDRLTEIVIEVPPLRARREDIPGLAEHFVARHAARHGVALPSLTDAARRACHAHAWPGNVRELEQVMSRAVVLADGGVVRERDLRLPTTDVGRDGPASFLTMRQQELLQIAATAGAVRRADVIRRFGVSGETARRELAALVRAGRLRQCGSRKTTRYEPA